ncbi:galactose-1-phosphate uridylyltransferase Gal7 [Schizosaccharomyces japonicus yFS275]|uniref:Galactose-1-phosphate uridylyltransferase n=1 Tax=Schizosaccharomyces japonicus (strain yFS275 / FY16936) TaxID=402676 RepID=B6K2X9_SCHJY|nr:galactose-1-phosphate uridylyltransferase Gal7 [Schizosaccharomyces japonicus yFS275]EEB07836.1 galactose-1-phosphate uridylyltransferase Gal7 [Schizosaccharomyces japonicus yFS275]
MTQRFNFSDHSHRRYNPLTDSWILCSPHRAKRPWQGAQESEKKGDSVSYDPNCYLCPGNLRAAGSRNLNYTQTFVFQNDYAAVKIDQPDYRSEEETIEGTEIGLLKKRLFKARGVRGNCFVICFSPKHNVTLPLMNLTELETVVQTWKDLYLKLQGNGKNGTVKYRYLQLFENKGAAMGCSNPHPHCQAWCLDTLPSLVERELTNMTNYRRKYGSHLLDDYVKLELNEKERVVLDNDSFTVVVPYWALWPFEVLLISKEHLHSLEDFNEKHKADLASILKKLTIKYDNLFNCSFPYSMGIHQAPLYGTTEERANSWFHMHFYPPLLRSAYIKKFCVGFELLGEPQRDLTSEQAAARLQALDGEHHYSESA